MILSIGPSTCITLKIWQKWYKSNVRTFRIWSRLGNHYWFLFPHSFVNEKQHGWLQHIVTSFDFYSQPHRIDWQNRYPYKSSLTLNMNFILLIGDWHWRTNANAAIMKKFCNVEEISDYYLIAISNHQWLDKYHIHLGNQHPASWLQLHYTVSFIWHRQLQNQRGINSALMYIELLVYYFWNRFLDEYQHSSSSRNSLCMEARYMQSGFDYISLPQMTKISREAMMNILDEAYIIIIPYIITLIYKAPLESCVWYMSYMVI